MPIIIIDAMQEEIRPGFHRTVRGGNCEAHMESLQAIKEIVRILMNSRCYFDLDLRERHRLVKYLLGSHPAVDFSR